MNYISDDWWIMDLIIVITTSIYMLVSEKIGVPPSYHLFYRKGCCEHQKKHEILGIYSLDTVDGFMIF